MVEESLYERLFRHHTQSFSAKRRGLFGSERSLLTRAEPQAPPPKAKAKTPKKPKRIPPTKTVLVSAASRVSEIETEADHVSDTMSSKAEPEPIPNEIETTSVLSDPLSESELDFEREEEPETESESIPAMTSEPAAESEPNTESVPVPVVSSDPLLESEPEADTESVSDPEPEDDRVPPSDHLFQAASKDEQGVEIVPVPQTMTEDPILKPEAEAINELEPEPVMEPLTEPVMEPEPEPVIEPAMEHVTEPVTEELVTEPEEPAMEPEPEPVIEPAMEHVTEPES
eukprot:scaffold596273_cov51-Attheya_sp.AAC.1